MANVARFPLIRFKTDPALQPGGRGARKVAVTNVYPDTEHALGDAEWFPPETARESAPVITVPDTEIAVFTQDARQERHLHKRGTEIYELLEGLITIEAGDAEYTLGQGDMLVVHPGTPHVVKKTDIPFLCRVICVNCGGPEDKYAV